MTNEKQTETYENQIGFGAPATASQYHLARGEVELLMNRQNASDGWVNGFSNAGMVSGYFIIFK